LNELSHKRTVAMGMENSITEKYLDHKIMKFFGSDPQHPLKEHEFAEFWKSLTDEEKDEFRKADLSE
jgi:hypothetical protein